MSKPTFKFTKDSLDCIAQAGIYSVSHNSTTILPAEAVMGVFTFTKRHVFHDIFWQFLGAKNTQPMQQFITSSYAIDKKTVQGLKLQLHLDDAFNAPLTKIKEEGVQQCNFMAVLYAALGAVDQPTQERLLTTGLDIATAKEKLLKVIRLANSVDITGIDFFTTMHSMSTTLNLDIDQMDMFVDMGTITGNDLDDAVLTSTPSSDTESAKKTGSVTMSSGSDTLDTPPTEESKPDASSSADEKKLTIEYFATDLTDDAANDNLDPVIGRDKEIQQMIYTLLRKTKNNPMLVGEAGVGKTAIVEGLAQRIASDDVPEKLKGKRIMMLDMGSLVAGTKYRGEFESRLKSIIDESTDPTNNIILFIDEIHTIIGAGNSEGSADAANMLKPLLARGKLQLIGATTFDEYQKYIEKDPALKRRFQDLHVDEPDPASTVKILQGLQGKYEEFHGVTLDPEALQAAVDRSTRYIMNKYLPDKAIDLIDEASARISTLSAKLEKNDEYVKVEKQIAAVHKKIEKAIEKQDYFKAAEHKETEEALKQKLIDLKQKSTLPKHLRPVVTKEHIGTVLSEKLGIPMHQISDSEIKKLGGLEEHINSFVLGQEEAVKQVVKAIQRNRLSAVERAKPIGSFLFLGASGVGKTFIAKLLAQKYFGDEKALIRVDMSEFMEKYSVSKLIGSAPGYVGYEEGGLLTEQVRRRPYSVVLFDEIEKASPDVLNILLQIMDEGHLKDNKGRWIDFKNTIIIMTSNIGSEEFGKKQVTIGFGGGGSETVTEVKDKQFAQIKERVEARVKDHMAPELLNRLSATVVFKPLSKELLTKIFKNSLKEFMGHWKKKHPAMNLPKFTAKKISGIIDEIYNPAYGARPIERYIHNTIEPQLIEEVMKGG